MVIGDFPGVDHQINEESEQDQKAEIKNGCADGGNDRKPRGQAMVIQEPLAASKGILFHTRIPVGTTNEFPWIIVPNEKRCCFEMSVLSSVASTEMIGLVGRI